MYYFSRPQRRIDPLADSAQKKLDSISDRKLKRGAVVTLSPSEINAWIHEKAVKPFPRGDSE